MVFGGIYEENNSFQVDLDHDCLRGRLRSTFLIGILDNPSYEIHIIKNCSFGRFGNSGEPFL